MPKVSKKRTLTGCVRRGVKHKHSSYSRGSHLSHADVGVRRILQRCMAVHGYGSLVLLRTLPLITVLFLLLGTTTIMNPTMSTAGAVAANYLLQAQTIRYKIYRNSFLYWLHLDHQYHDIPIGEGTAHEVHLPPQNIIFSSWTNQACYDLTSFKKYQLLRIYDCFGLEDIAAQNNGNIRVFNGHEYYNFHPEEIFLFLMTKCKTGLSNRIMCDFIFGGNASRWSLGFPWMLRYLDERYEDIIGHQNLINYVDQFPAFFDCIQERVKQDTLHHYNDGTAELFFGLRFLPYSTFSLLDCSIYRVYRPFSGPAGDYRGAPWKARYHHAQRSVYSGYIKGPGVKIETLKLPNGISTMFGPVSCCLHDVAEVLDMSGLDRFLFAIQQNNPHIYSAFGDHLYGTYGLQCIRSYYKRLGAGAPLTQYQEYCNSRMKSIREAIEWDYGEVSTIFQLSVDAKKHKLGKGRQYVPETIRVCHLLANIYNYLNGDKASGLDMFCCPPPTLEQYLNLNQ